MRYFFPLSPYNQQRQFEKPVWVYPAHLAMYATHLQNEGHDVIWGDAELERRSIKAPGTKHFAWIGELTMVKDDFQIDVPFEKLPFPDRTLTDAKNKRWQSYGNYKFHPATHYMSSNLCWWAGERGCIFCIDSKKIMEGEHRGVRTTDHVMSEIEDCVSLCFKEMFDDAGTIPINEWLNDLCHKMIKSKLNKKMVLGCNLKPIKQDFKLMKEAGFRFILVGVESANQATIDRIQKGQHSDKVIENIKSMSDAGLEPHITTMTTYPWETVEEEENNKRQFQYLLRKGYAKTGQVSIYSPPRTKPDPNSIGHQRLPRYYDVYKSPEFWYRKISDIHRWEDFTYLLRGGRLVAEEKWRKMCHHLKKK